MFSKQICKPRNLILIVCAILLLLATASGQEPQPADVIRIDANLVSVPVIVSDRQNRYLPGLTAADFKLYDNTAEQQIAFFDAAEEPLNIALLLDTSRSTEGVLKKIKKAAKNFLKELRQQDRAMIVSFDFAVHRLSPLTSDRKALEKAIGSAEVGERFGTTLNDAVLGILDNDFKSISGRKAVILLTDGEDFGSRFSSTELLADAAEADTMIYSIFYPASPGRPFNNGRGPGGGRGRGRGPLGGIFGRRGPIGGQGGGQNGPMGVPQGGRRFPPAGGRPDPSERRERREERSEDAVQFLTKLSEETSGRFYRSEVTDLEKSFAFIAEELRYQYRLGFYPQTADGNLHALMVKVDRPDVAVRSRRQYRTALPK